MIKGVIYNLGDVIINSESLRAEAVDEVLMTHKVKRKNIPAELRTEFLGRRTIDVVDYLKESFKLKQDPKELQNEIDTEYFELAKQKLQLLPGVHESIKRIMNKLWKIALTTTANRKFVDMVLEKFNLVDYFRVILTGEDVQKGVPDSQLYKKAVENLELKSDECVVFEDSAVGIEAAKAAGCYCIAVSNPYIPDQDLTQADLIADSLKEIDAEMVNKLSS